MPYAYPIDSVVTFDTAGTPSYDRGVNSKTLRKIYNLFMQNGIFLQTNNDFVVTAGNSGYTIVVGSGSCIIEGCMKIIENARTLTVQNSDTNYDRIDTVVLRLNLNQAVRDIDLYISQGTASASPVRPELTRDASVYELGLADIFVAKNTQTMSQKRITDTRLDTERCGIVTAITQFDTTNLYNQIQADLQSFQDVNQVAYSVWAQQMQTTYQNWQTEYEETLMTWFNHIQGQIGNDAAVNLQAQIDALKYIYQKDKTVYIPTTVASKVDSTLVFANPVQQTEQP